MNSGIARGLASVSGQYDEKINSLYRNQQLDKQAQQLASARAELLTGDLEYDGAMNAHDAPLIKQYANDKIKKIGEYYRNNPDAQWNPEKLAEIKAMKRELKNHPDLLRGKATDMSYAEYVKDLQEVRKNPANYDVEAYNDYQKQYQNYLQFGNQRGAEAAQSEGKQPFTYARPQNLMDLAVELPKMGGSINNREYIKGEGGEYYTDAPQSAVDAIKAAVYSQNGRSVQVTANKLGLTDPKQIDQWVEAQIRAGIKNDYHPGDPYAKERLEIARGHLALGRQKEARESAQNGPTTSTWDHMVNPVNKSGGVDTKTANDIWGDHEVKLVSGNGTTVDLTGLGTWKSTGRFNKATTGKIKGAPVLDGYMDIPLAVAKEKGIVKDGWFSDEVAPGFGTKVSIEKGVNAKGKEYEYVRVKHPMIIDPNDQTAKSRYEIGTMPSKLVEQTTDVFAPQELYEDEAGNLFSDPEGKKFVGKK